MGYLSNVMLNTVEKELEADRRRDRIMRHWLSGFSIEDIAEKEVISRETVIKDISIRRKTLRALHDQDINDLAAERIEGLRLIQKDAIYYQNLFPDRAAPLLGIRIRVEETIGKIQGVLNEKVVHLGKIEHVVKMYDFEDKFPEPLPPGQIVEGTASIVLEEPQVGEKMEQSVIIESEAVTVTVESKQPENKKPTIVTSWN